MQCWWESKTGTTTWEKFGWFLVKVNMYLSYGQIMPPLSTYLREIKTCLQKDLCENVDSNLIVNSANLKTTQLFPWSSSQEHFLLWKKLREFWQRNEVDHPRSHEEKAWPKEQMTHVLTLQTCTKDHPLTWFWITHLGHLAFPLSGQGKPREMEPFFFCVGSCPAPGVLEWELIVCLSQVCIQWCHMGNMKPAWWENLHHRHWQMLH